MILVKGWSQIARVQIPVLLLNIGKLLDFSFPNAKQKQTKANNMRMIPNSQWCFED